MTPRYLYVGPWLISELGIFTGGSWRLGGFPKMISSVFTVMRVYPLLGIIMRELLSHHSINQSTLSWYSVWSSDWVNGVESSEYFLIYWFGTLVVQSDMYRVNNTGELTQPWGTPTLVVLGIGVLGEDRVSFTLTNRTLFVRKEKYQWIRSETSSET